MDILQTAKEQWKAVQDIANTTTNIALVLFAALIISWTAMWGHVSNYRGTVAYHKWISNSKQRRLQTAVQQEQLNDAVQGRLLFLAYDRLRDRCIERRKLIATAQGKPEPLDLKEKCSQEQSDTTVADRGANRLAAAAVQPLVHSKHNPAPDVNQLLKTHGGDWQGPFIAEAIRIENGLLVSERQHSARQLQAKRALAESTSFKLLGLDFEINGWWAWNVWLLFFFAGMLHIWLARRALIRRSRRIGKLLSLPARPSAQEVRAMKASLPLWMRPLPRRERWVSLLGNRVRLDLAYDWLGALTTILMLASFVLAVLAAWMGVISTLILRTEGRNEVEASAHEITLVVLCGLIIAIVSNWFAVPAPNGPPEGSDRESLELAGRRTWIAGALGVTVSFLLYRPSVSKFLGENLFLRSPRYARSRKGRHPKMKLQQKLQEGFYVDSAGTIHHVSREGGSKSIQRLQLQTSVSPWAGTFNSESLANVHPSAIVPFVRAAVVQKLKCLGHQRLARLEGEKFNDLEARIAQHKAALVAHPENLARFRDTFDLVRESITKEMAWRMQRGALPNIQLFDLLARVAMSANSPQMVKEAIQLFSEVTVKDIRPSPPPKPSAEDKSRPKHSRHSRKKAKKNFWERRLARLNCYKRDRVSPGQKKARQATPASHTSPRLPGVWISWLRANSLQRSIAANDIHLVRDRQLRKCDWNPREVRRCARIHRKDIVQSRVCGPV